MIIWNIKEILKAQNMTLAGLVERSGVSRAEIYKIISGKSDPKFSTVVHIAEALNVKIDELFYTKP